LGIGPSAHSFDLRTRRWNVASIAKYLEGIENGQLYFEEEILTEQDRYNDFIITGLRTSWGISEDKVRKIFSPRFYSHFLAMKEKYSGLGYVINASGTVCLSSEGMFISDKIMADFMVVESC
jgi:oxygen-independent coproporphyrinogen-3 oxidase